MNEYEIGRDLQELRSRMERLEAVVSGGKRSAGAGATESHRTSGGIDTHKAPIVWKQQKGTKLPPFAHSALGLPHPVHADATEVTTWSCSPEPLILYVNFDGGLTDEYYRFTGQTFSFLRFTDPNTGKTTAIATYEAQLTASGRWQPDYTQLGGAGNLFFHIDVRDKDGGWLFSFERQIVIDCRYNQSWVNSYEFEPALYDLIKGANWQIRGGQSVRSC